MHGIDHTSALQKLSLRMHLMRVIGNRDLVDRINGTFVRSPRSSTSSVPALPPTQLSAITRAFHEKGVYVGTSSERLAAFTLFELQEKHRIPLLHSLQQFRRLKWQIAGQEATPLDSHALPSALAGVHSEQRSHTRVLASTSPPRTDAAGGRDACTRKVKQPHIYPCAHRHGAKTPMACHTPMGELHARATCEGAAAGRSDTAAASPNTRDRGGRAPSAAALSLSPSPLCPSRGGARCVDKEVSAPQPHASAVTPPHPSALSPTAGVVSASYHPCAAQVELRSVGAVADMLLCTEDAHFAMNNQVRKSRLLSTVSAMRKSASPCETAAASEVIRKESDASVRWSRAVCMCDGPEANKRTEGGNNTAPPILHVPAPSLDWRKTESLSTAGNEWSSHTFLSHNTATTSDARDMTLNGAKRNEDDTDCLRPMMVGNDDGPANRDGAMARLSNAGALQPTITHQEQCDGFYYFCANPTALWPTPVSTMDVSSG